MTRKENIISIQPETVDPTAPPRQIITQEIMRPEEMATINTHHRLMWRINNVVCKVMHELFLSISHMDVVVITGKQSDATVFQAVCEVFGSAGWFALWMRRDNPEQNTVLMVAQSAQTVIDSFEKELKLDRADWIARGWIANPEAPRTDSQNTGGESGGKAEGGKHAPPSKGAPERN